MRNFKCSLLSLLLPSLSLLALSACVSAPKAPVQVRSDKLTVLTFNVENLFDTEDDPHKNDEAFLPARDKVDPAVANRCRVQNESKFRADECLNRNWTEATLKRKFARLADVLRQVDGGRGPDILILQEVENRKVLEMWRDGYLKDMNYETISHLESPDERGIDTAVMSRLKLAGETKLHRLDYSKAPELEAENLRPTRGILETHLELPNGETLAVFSVHFPSQGAPTIHRKVAVLTLLDVVAKVPEGTPVIVGGDFNITAPEEWKEKYFRKTISPKLTVSHLVGCGRCPGSIYYWPNKTWSFFDVLLFSPDLDGGGSPWQLDRASIKTIDSSRYQINRWGSPARFGDGRGTVGVTDHLPIYAELNFRGGDQARGAE